MSISLMVINFEWVIIPASKLTDEEIKMIHTKMSGEAGIAEKGYYNRCLRPLQIEFIGKHPEKIKRVIRLIKYWIKTKNVR